MANGVHIEQATFSSTVENTPCCGTPQVEMQCRVKQAYGTKCGYVPRPFAAAPRFFRAVTALITSTINGSLEYTEEPPPDPPGREGNTTCDYTFAAGCGTATWSASYEYHTDDLGGEESTGSDSGTGDGTGISICPGVYQAWEGVTGPHAFGFTEFSSGYLWSGATLIAPSPGCENWSISFSDTRTGHVSDTPEYDYEETAAVSGSITACDEHTTAILMEDVDVEAAEAEPEGWTDFEGDEEETPTCCGTRDLSTDQTIYFVDELEIRFVYVPACMGGVRITYKVVTTTNGVDEEEVFTVDNPGGGAIAISLPAVPETSGQWKVSVCVTEFTATYL